MVFSHSYPAIIFNLVANDKIVRNVFPKKQLPCMDSDKVLLRKCTPSLTVNFSELITNVFNNIITFITFIGPKVECPLVMTLYADGTEIISCAVIDSVEQCVSTQTERLSVPLKSHFCIVFIWMLFQAKPGTGLDFRRPKCEPRELGSFRKRGEIEHHSEAKQTQKSEVYLKSPVLY